MLINHVETQSDFPKQVLNNQRQPKGITNKIIRGIYNYESKNGDMMG